MKKMRKEDKSEVVEAEPLQIFVNGSFEGAVQKFKSLFQKEKVIAKYKEKQAYEKPSEKKRRKQREAEERRLVTAKREELIASGEWEKRQAKKEAKRQVKMKDRADKQVKENG